MKIVYSPDCSGTVWTGVTKGICLDGYAVKNTAGLIELLEFRCGIHHQDDQVERLMAYRKAMQSYAGIFSSSFELDDIATAKECLKVRDAAMMLGWDGTAETGTPRLDSLAAIEKYFDSMKFPSVAERIRRLTEQKVDLSDDGNDAVIVTAVDQDCLSPIIQTLLQSIQGCTFHTLEEEFHLERENDLSAFADSIMKGTAFCPSDADGSLEVRRYASQIDMLDDLVYGNNRYDVWIDRDSLMLDSWCSYANQALPGAQVFDVTPPTTQLFYIAMNLFLDPDNASNVLAYLSSWGCPVKNSFTLANDFRKNGGFIGCPTLDGSVLLPRKDDFALPGNKFRRQAVIDFVEAYLKAIPHLMGLADTDAKQEQLGMLSSLLKTVESLLKESSSAELERKDLERWVRSISPSIDKTVSFAQITSFFTISFPDSILAPANATIWLSSAYSTVKNNISRILSLPEIESLASFGFSEDYESLVSRESRYHIQTLAIPARMTREKLVLCLYENEDKMEEAVNPLLVRLLSFKEFKKGETNPLVKVVTLPHTSTPTIIPDNKLNQDANGIVRVAIDPTKPLVWRPVESPSSLELLAQDPLDYVLKYFLKFNDDDSQQLPSLPIMKGNVAHLTIQDILCNKQADDHSKIDAAFDASFEKAVRDKGLSLHSSENELVRYTLKKALLSYTHNLLDIIKNNGYEVEAVEKSVNDGGDILCPGASSKSVEVAGSIDMLLRKVDDHNHKFILDFKFSSHWDNYTSLLEKGRAIQLALYKAALETTGVIVDGTAYFLMSDVSAKIYSADNVLTGGDVVLCGHMNYDDVVKNTHNTYWERRDKINKGLLELGTTDTGDGMELTLLAYFQNILKGDDLLPLKTDKSGVAKNVSLNFKNVKK